MMASTKSQGTHCARMRVYADFLFIDTVSESVKELVTRIIIILVLLFAVAVVFAFIKLTREEMELAPLRRRLRAAHAKGEDVDMVVHECRVEQRKKAEREEEERQVALLKKKDMTSHNDDDDKDCAAPKQDEAESRNGVTKINCISTWNSRCRPMTENWQRCARLCSQATRTTGEWRT